MQENKYFIKYFSKSDWANCDLRPYGADTDEDGNMSLYLLM